MTKPDTAVTDTSAYKHFCVTNIDPDFYQMGVDKDDHTSINGVVALLDDGKLYMGHDVCEENERLLYTSPLPEWFDVDDDQTAEALNEAVFDMLYSRFGILSETYKVELLTEGDYQEICNNPIYRKKVSSPIIEDAMDWWGNA